MGSTILVKRDRLEALFRHLDYLEPEEAGAQFQRWYTVMGMVNAMLRKQDHEEPAAIGSAGYGPQSATRDTSADVGTVPTVTTTAPHKWQEGMLRVDVENIPELVTRGEVKQMIEEAIKAAPYVHEAFAAALAERVAKLEGAEDKYQGLLKALLTRVQNPDGYDPLAPISCSNQPPNCIGWFRGEGRCVHNLKPCPVGCSFKVPREVT